MIRFLKDRQYKLLTQVEASIISQKILTLQDFLDESITEVNLNNNDELFDSANRLLFMEMISFILDTALTMTLVVSCRNICFRKNYNCGSLWFLTICFDDFFPQLCFTVDGSVFKPILILHDHQVKTDTLDLFRNGFYFKQNENGVMDKASLDFVLDCVARLDILFFPIPGIEVPWQHLPRLNFSRFYIPARLTRPKYKSLWDWLWAMILPIIIL